jgi:hypothetical protein
MVEVQGGGATAAIARHGEEPGLGAAGRRRYGVFQLPDTLVPVGIGKDLCGVNGGPGLPADHKALAFSHLVQPSCATVHGRVFRPPTHPHTLRRPGQGEPAGKAPGGPRLGALLRNSGCGVGVRSRVLAPRSHWFESSPGSCIGIHAAARLAVTLPS